MARQSACRTTEIAHHRMTAKSQSRTIASKNGCLRFSASWFPVAKKIAAVPMPKSNATSERITLGEPFVRFALEFEYVVPDMGRAYRVRPRHAIGQRRSSAISIHRPTLLRDSPGDIVESIAEEI